MEPQELREIRAGLGYSQRKFADFLGVRQNTIWRWENGREAISHPWPNYIRLVMSVGSIEPAQPTRKSA